MITTRETWPDEFEQVVQFYEEAGYGSAISPSDAIVVAEDDGTLCGAARLCIERGVLVLRGMRISEAYQHHGISATLLHALVPVIGARECFSIPYRFLRSLYNQIGFVEIEPALAPTFLAERYAGYRQEGGLDVIMMRRPSSRETRAIQDANATTRPIKVITEETSPGMEPEAETRPNIKKKDIKRDIQGGPQTE
jgi:N-acetylglutamate synthase-like GNAT family acetyltransferase